MKRVYLIAEIGCNHNGEMAVAKRTIDRAQQSGANAAKFQMYVTEKINDPALHPFLERVRLTTDQHKELKKHCRLKGIDYLCSAFDVESLLELRKMKMGTYKIPSGQIHNQPYLKLVGSFRKKIIMSTGMATFNEVKQAVKILLDAGTKTRNITLMHCTTAYPAPLIEANMKAIEQLKKISSNVGYSDHCEDVTPAILAIAFGATVIEKHFIGFTDFDTPDLPVSLDPEDFFCYTRIIRGTERALGSGIKAPVPSEEPNMFRRDVRGY